MSQVKRTLDSTEPGHQSLLFCHDSGESMSAAESPFQPRPFPPPSLVGVPIEYIIDQLHNLAPHYWDKPDTADCTIIVPVPYPRNSTFPPNTPRPSYDPSGHGRRLTEPTINFIPRIVLQLHTDYLCAHSSYLRALFSGASQFDLINPTTPLRTQSGKFTIPANRLPRLMPGSTPDHPILHLPVPDPSSFHLLVHWMYFGDIKYIAECLNTGIIQWEGIARNVEYLGLPTEIKVFLGQWYGAWLHHSRARYPSQERDNDNDTIMSSDSDDDSASDSDSDEDNYHDGDFDDEYQEEVSSCTSVLDMEDEAEMRRKHIIYADAEPSRGRTRTIRCLSWTPGKPEDEEERDPRRATWSGPAVLYETDGDGDISIPPIPS